MLLEHLPVSEHSGTIIDALTFMSECRNILISLMMLEHLPVSEHSGAIIDA
jgi:hypothetical protein